MNYSVYPLARFSEDAPGSAVPAAQPRLTFTEQIIMAVVASVVTTIITQSLLRKLNVIR